MFDRVRILRRFALAVIILSFAVVTLAGAARAGEPSVKAIDDAVLVEFPKDPHYGMSISIAHDGRIVYEKGYGVRDNGTPDRFISKDQDFYSVPFARPQTGRAAADPRTIYAIGSVTRQFTAAAILLLSEERRLGLDDPVSRYIPEINQPNLTLRMLLTQRSGLPDMNTLAFLQRVLPLAKRPDGSLDENRIIREIAVLPLDFQPGTRFEYSTSNYVALGAVVERITHQPLGTFLGATIFRPLGMTRTAYATTAAADDVAVGYRLDQSGAIRRAYPWNLAWLGGAGAMTSTVQDLGRWNVALLAHRVLQPASLAQMWHGLDAGSGQGLYAMGWVEDALGSHRYLWHNGEVGGFHAFNVIFPEDDLAFAILTNNQDARPEFLLPSIASLYFPVGGLDRIVPHSGVVLIEASLAVGLGALAIAIVAILTLKRFIVAGLVAALLALVAGFFAPTFVGFIWAGAIALVPVAGYLLAVRYIPKTPPKPLTPPKKARSR